MSKFKKIDKEFLVTDSSVNCYGYRLLTTGYLMGEYQKNPIGFYMHKDRDNGVLVKWENLRVDGDKVYGKPVINLSHERGPRTVDEIESGFLNAASMGHFVVLEVSDKPEDYLEGQSGPSVSKWYNRELSLVDIPGNYNALTDLYDENDNPIKLENLSDFKPQNLNMSKFFLTPEQLQLMNLKADANQASIETALNDLVAKAAKVDGLTTELAAAVTAKTTAETALDNFKTEGAKVKIENLIATNVGKKITVELGNQLKADYATNPEGLEKVLNAMPALVSITSQLDSKETGNDLSKKTWTELDNEDKLENLKATNIELFKSKYKDQFGKEYTGA